MQVEKIENVELTDSNRYEIYDYIDNNYRTDYIFVKSNDMIKNPFNGDYRSIDLYNKELFLNGSYQISEHIDIVSEYRCFIYNDKIVGIQYYSGDFEYFPDASKIYDFIGEYQYDYGKGNAPQAYTLDVLVDDDGFTYVMECHEFFSCGLYEHSFIYVSLKILGRNEMIDAENSTFQLRPEAFNRIGMGISIYKLLCPMIDNGVSIFRFNQSIVADVFISEDS